MNLEGLNQKRLLAERKWKEAQERADEAKREADRLWRVAAVLGDEWMEEKKKRLSLIKYAEKNKSYIGDCTEFLKRDSLP